MPAARPISRCATVVAVTLAVAACGGGSHAKTVTSTVAVASPPPAPTTTTSTTGATSTTSTTAAPAPPPHPTDHAVNLTATPAMKEQLRVAAERAGRADSVGLPPKERVATVSGPAPGTTYYAGWGGYEYARASFTPKPVPLVTDYVGRFYRKVGGPWVAALMVFQGDVECDMPRAFHAVWGDAANGCATLVPKHANRRTVADLSQRYLCDANMGASHSGLTCGRFSRSGKSTNAMTMNPGTPAEHVPATLDIGTMYPDDIAGYGIPYVMHLPDTQYVCTFVPTGVTCVDGRGGKLSVS